MVNCVPSLVSGKVQSGSLVAVVGASGCGKTTFMAAISKRLKGNITGQILLNGQPIDETLLKKISGFVPQNCISINTLTTNEHLYFMARMRMDHRVKSEVMHKWVQALLIDLNLRGCQDTRLSSLSGGERRRLALATELLTDPPILFCDEPTTGLDSSSALSVVEKLRHLANTGKVVICTIHQPASDTFNCFHEVVLLSAGRVAYHGPLQQLQQLFGSFGYVCPTTFNPCDYYVKQLVIIPGKEEESLERINSVCEAFDNSDWGKALKQCKPSESQHALFSSQHKIQNGFEKYVTICKPRWIEQVFWLIWRDLKNSSRNVASQFINAAVFFATSIILATFFMDVKFEVQNGVQDVHGILYLISSEVIFVSAYSVFNTFPQEIPVFLREAGCYDSSAYYVAKILALIPRTIIDPSIFLGVIYVFVNFSVGYFTLLLPVILSAQAATAYGCMLSGAFESVDIAMMVAVPVDLVSLLLAGMFYNIRALPMSIRWMKYLSIFYYSNEALTVLHWQDVTHIKCSEDPNLPCFQNGLQVIKEYGFSPHNLMLDILALIALYVMFNVIGFIGVWFRSKKQASY